MGSGRDQSYQRSLRDPSARDLVAANGPKIGKEGGRSEYCARLAVQHVHYGDPHCGDDQVLHRNKGL